MLLRLERLSLEQCQEQAIIEAESDQPYSEVSDPAFTNGWRIAIDRRYTPHVSLN